MELKVFNNQMGCFNLLNPSQKTFEFSMGICEDGVYKAIEVNGVKAIISFSGDENDAYDFEDPIDNLGVVFSKCFAYADRVWSTVNYKDQCLLFAKLYQENVDAMDAVMVEKHKIKTQKKIEQLQKELNISSILYDLTDEINDAIKDKVSRIKKSIAFKEKEISELKEDSESYQKAKSMIDGYISEIEKYEKHLIVSAD